MQIAIAEIVYAICLNRNKVIFNKEYSDSHITYSIIERIVNRMWVYPKYIYRERVAQLIWFTFFGYMASVCCDGPFGPRFVLNCFFG